MQAIERGYPRWKLLQFFRECWRVGWFFRGSLTILLDFSTFQRNLISLLKIFNPNPILNNRIDSNSLKQEIEVFELHQQAPQSHRKYFAGNLLTSIHLRGASPHHTDESGKCHGNCASNFRHFPRWWKKATRCGGVSARCFFAKLDKFNKSRLWKRRPQVDFAKTWYQKWGGWLFWGGSHPIFINAMV